MLQKITACVAYKHSIAHKYVTGRKQKLLRCSPSLYQNTMLTSREVHELTLMNHKTAALESDCKSHSTKLTYRLNWLNTYQRKL